MKNYQTQTKYTNYKGGVNNLQICDVVYEMPISGVLNIIKTFSSKKMKAEKRAQRFINNLT